MVTYFVTRRCATGVNDYRYFRSVYPMGTGAAQVLPRFPVSVRGQGLDLHGGNDLDATLIPGISSPVFDAHSPREYARVFWDGSGKHRLHTPFGNFRVRHRDGFYSFFQGDSLIAEMYRVRRTAPAARETEWKPFLVMLAYRPLPGELALLMLSFPLFQIGF